MDRLRTWRGSLRDKLQWYRRVAPDEPTLRLQVNCHHRIMRLVGAWDVLLG